MRAFLLFLLIVCLGTAALLQFDPVWVKHAVGSSDADIALSYNIAGFTAIVLAVFILMLSGSGSREDRLEARFNKWREEMKAAKRDIELHSNEIGRHEELIDEHATVIDSDGELQAKFADMFSRREAYLLRSVGKLSRMADRLQGKVRNAGGTILGRAAQGELQRLQAVFASMEDDLRSLSGEGGVFNTVSALEETRGKIEEQLEALEGGTSIDDDISTLQQFVEETRDRIKAAGSSSAKLPAIGQELSELLGKVTPLQDPQTGMKASIRRMTDLCDTIEHSLDSIDLDDFEDNPGALKSRIDTIYQRFATLQEEADKMAATARPLHVVGG